LWDACAVDIIVREAGGNSYDLEGNPINYLSKHTELEKGYIAVGK